LRLTTMVPAKVQAAEKVMGVKPEVGLAVMTKVEPVVKLMLVPLTLAPRPKDTVPPNTTLIADAAVKPALRPTPKVPETTTGPELLPAPVVPR